MIASAFFDRFQPAWVGRFLVSLLTFAVAVQVVRGQEQPAALVRIAVPITSSVDGTLRTLNRLVAEQDRRKSGAAERLCLVLEFWPKDVDSATAASTFEPCLALARQLASPRMDSIKTVAYLPRSVVGHAVLPVLACEQIVMHPEAELGGIGSTDESASVGVRAHYREIADRRRTIPAAVALGMLDPSLGVFRVVTDKGARFVLEDELPPLRDDPGVQSIDTVMTSGGSGRLNGRDLRLKWSLVSQLAEDATQLPEILGVRAAALEPDPSLAAGWKPVRFEVRGIPSPQTSERLVRTIDDQIRDGVNLILVVIDSPGGSLEASAKIAGHLAALDRTKVRTVAVVEQQARADAALIALACDQLVMRRGSILGGPGEYQPTPQQLLDMRSVIEQWGKDKSRHWSLPVGMLDPSVELFRYQLEGTTVNEVFCEEEWQQQKDPARWVKGEPISVAGEPARLDAAQADNLGMLWLLMEDERNLWDAYGLEKPPPQAEPSWATEFVHTLASPRVAWSLLFFAGFAMISELATPGLGAGAFSAAICLVLYFWSQFLHGTANWLEIMLFLSGLGCVALELLVLPGFGIFGFGGGVLIIASLVLASQTFVWPQNSYQYEQLPRSLLTVLAGGGGLIVGLIVLRHYMDKAPILRNVMLQPPEGEMQEQLSQRESLADYSQLMDQVGITTTLLMPSGKARFGDELVDVITEGDVVNPGASIRVIEVRGSRVVVRPS